MSDYVQHFGAVAPRHYCTGSIEASRQAQIAFGVYRSVKMTHGAVGLLRAAPGGDRVHFDGFVKAEELKAK